MNYVFFMKKCNVLCLLFLCCFIFLATPQLFATPFNTLDTDGMPFYVDEKIENDPDKFIKNMEEFLRLGNLDAAGSLAMQLAGIRGSDIRVAALNSLFLASQGNTKAAEMWLKNIAGTEKNAYALYAKALIARQEKKYDESVTLCKKAISMDRTHPYPWNILGRTQFDQGQNKEAIASFKKAIRLEPKFLPAHSNLGAVASVTGDHETAITHFKRAIELNSHAYNAHFGLAMVYKNLDRHSLAVEQLEKSIEINPENPPAWKELTISLFKAKQYKKAIATGHKMEKRGMPGAYKVLSEAALHLGDPEKALEYLEDSPQDDPDINYLRGFCYMMLERHKLALEQMEKVLQKNTGHFGAYIARAGLKFYLGQKISVNSELKTGWGESLDKFVYFLRGCITASQDEWSPTVKNWRSAQGVIQGFSIDGMDEGILSKGSIKNELPYLTTGLIYYFRNLYDPSLLEFKKALKINEKSIMSNYWAAQVFLKNGKREEAISFFKRSLEQAPRFFAALYGVAELSFLAGNNKEAVTYYTKAITVKNDPGILIKLGLIHENSKQYDKAENYYKQFIKAFPDFFIGYNQLAWLYAKRGVQLDEALKLAKKANKIQPGNLSILDTLGWIHFHKKDYDKAIKYLKEAVGISSNNPTVLYHLGSTLQAAGEKTEARKYLNMALQLSGDFEEAEETIKLLNQ